MPDIRNFFQPKGGAPAAKPTPKPPPKKEDDTAKKGRGSELAPNILMNAA
jgi:hypothetical protein